MDDKIIPEDAANLLKANKRLERQLDMIKSLSNAVKEGVFIVEESGATRFSNEYGRRMLKIGEGGNVFKALPHLKADLLEGMREQKHMVKELNLSYPEHKVLKASIVPFQSEDAARGRTIALVLVDITCEKRSTDELIESEKISSLLKLASGIAHEIGNPLNSIGIHLQVSRRQVAKLSAQDAARKIDDSLKVCQQEIDRLKNIIENFLKALRPIKPSFSELNAMEPLMQTIKLLHEEIKDRGASVDISAADPLPTVLADENLLKQLYFNILKNSLEALGESGKISIAAAEDDEFVRLKFADNGAGMSRENLAHMFEPYFTTKDYGHGLGMMIIENIVKAHGGEIKVESELGRGTAVEVCLPRKTRRIRYLKQG